MDIDNFIDAEINAFQVAPLAAEKAEKQTAKHLKASASAANTAGDKDLLEDGYSDESWQIAQYLTTLKKPEGLSRTEFRSFKRNALQYAVLDGNLYRRAGKHVPQRLVIDSDERKAEILKELHNDCSHNGRESTYRQVADQYYWENCYEDTKAFVASCD